MGAVCCCCRDEPVDFDEEVNLFHFDLHRAVGKGAFGKVRVVEHKQDHTLYALKYINKKSVINMKAVTNIIQERRLLEEIDHPFVVNMRYAFQDDENCFFVLDLMLGGDLRFHFERKLSLGENSVRFYVAELSSAVHFLHTKHILHRDIKPDNVLLDIHGHAHLTDFNVACHFEDRKYLTSVAGTIYYMAPEIIRRKGYTYTVDWWSLGVLAYELLFGRRPFRGKKSVEVMRAIMSDNLEFTPEANKLSSQAGIDCINSLLDKSPNKRLGCKPRGEGLAELRRHRWFQGFDWEKLERKELPPPFVPDSKKLNFDFGHELDEYMMPSDLLTHQKRKANRDLSKMPKDMLQMEDDFTVYDFKKTQRKSYFHLTQPLTPVKPSAMSITPVPSRPSTALQTPEPAILSASPLQQMTEACQLAQTSTRSSSLHLSQQSSRLSQPSALPIESIPRSPSASHQSRR